MSPQQTEPTDQRILDETIAHVRRHGVKRTTVTSVADALGMTHANVYRYYSSKAALIDAVSAHWLKPLEANLRDIVDAPDPAPDKLDRIAGAVHRAYRDTLDAEPNLFDLFVEAAAEQRGVARKHRSKLQAAIQSVVDEGMGTGSFAQADRPRAVAFVFDALHRFIHPVAVGLDRDAPGAAMEQRRERVTRAVLRGLAAGRL